MTCPSCMGRIPASSPLRQGLHWGTAHRKPLKGSFTASSPHLGVHMLLAQCLVLCTDFSITIHSFTPLQIHQDPSEQNTSLLRMAKTDEATG